MFPRRLYSPVFALCGTLLLFTSLATRAQNVLPAPPAPVHPASNPALPAGADPFLPPVTDSLVSPNAPQFGEWTRNNVPDSTLTAYGANFAPVAANGKFVVFAQTADNKTQLTEAPLTYLDGDSRALVQLPATLPTNSAYMLWARNHVGYGRPILLNGTELWWAGPNVAASGDTVSAYGRNLTYWNSAAYVAPNATSRATQHPATVFAPRHLVNRAYVYIQPATGAGFWAATRAINPYKVDFVLPATLTPGTYQIWAHNGHGGAYGWSGPVTLTVAARTVWNGPVYDVRSFGATPDDGTDDEAAIQAAFDTARQHPYSTVYFPRGTYHAGRGFAIPPKVRVRGDGMNASRLAVHANFVTPPAFDGRRYALLFGSEGGYLVQDITLDANSNLNGYLKTLVFERGQFDMRFERVRLQAPGYAALDLHASSRVAFQNCEFIESGMFLGTATQILFQGCSFRGTYDVGELLTSWGGEQISVTGCKASDYDNSDLSSGAGWAEGRFFVAQGHWGPLNDVYFGDNRTLNLGPRPGNWNQNTGEQFLLEMGVTDFTGSPSAPVVGNQVTFAQFPLTADRASVLIVGGRGIGQVRRMTGFNTAAGTATLDKPFDIAPDATSRIAFGRYADRIAVFRNRFDGKANQVMQTDHVATTAVYWQAATRLAIDLNTLTEMRSSFSCFGIYDPDGPYPNAWAEITNNNSRLTRNGIFALATQYSDAKNSPRDPTVIAHTYRNNSVTSIDIGLSATDNWPTNDVSTLNVVFEKNRVDAPAGIAVRVHPDGSDTPGEVFLRGNTFKLPALQSLFAGTTPNQDNLTDNVAYEMGVKFSTLQAGSITALRFWKPSLETGSHTGKLWRQDGTLLATVKFTGETASGWQQATLATPVRLPAGNYAVTVNCNGFYPDTQHTFDNPVTFYSLVAPADGSNGVYGPIGQFPTGSYANSNYFRDVVFAPDP